MTPGTLRKNSSVPQKQPAANVAVSVGPRLPAVAARAIAKAGVPKNMPMLARRIAPLRKDIVSDLPGRHTGATVLGLRLTPFIRHQGITRTSVPFWRAPSARPSEGRHSGASLLMNRGSTFARPTPSQPWVGLLTLATSPRESFIPAA